MGKHRRLGGTKLGVVTMLMSVLTSATDAVGQCANEVHLSPNGITDDDFGNAIDMDGDIAVVGAWFDSRFGIPWTGAAYVYRHDGLRWQFEATLLPPDPAERGEFGGDVAIQGSTIVVGSPGDDDLGISSGSVYVFEQSGSEWEFRQKLLAPDGGAEDSFGSKIELDEANLVIGAWQDESRGGSIRLGLCFRATR